MIIQKHDLDVTPSGVLPVVNASQYDVGRIIKFYLYNESEVYNIPVGTSVLVNGIKPNGDAFSYSATYTDNVVTVTLTDQMTVIDGEVKCELRFADALGNDIGTTNFILLVERAPFDASIPISETEIPAIIELARAEQYNAEAWATGERNGVPVGPTDPTYHNNAKYWSENAQHGSLDNLSDVAISSPVGGQALVYDDVNDEWVNGNVSTVDTLDDLTDVSLASPTNGQVLTFNNNEWKNESIGVDDLDDIVITNPADDDGLVYDSTSQKWKNKQIVQKNQISNPNLLDNPWFIINQRGSATYSGIGYTVDRWARGAGDVSGHTLTLGDATGTQVTLTEVKGDLYQPLDSHTTYLLSRPYTISAYIDGVLYQHTFTPIADGQTHQIMPDIGVDNLQWNIIENWYADAHLVGINNLASTTDHYITKIKLELGTFSTLYMDNTPNYAEELLKCQRYYYRTPSDIQPSITQSAHTVMALSTLYTNGFAFPVEMRTTPSINIIKMTEFFAAQVSANEPFLP